MIRELTDLLTQPNQLREYDLYQDYGAPAILHRNCGFLESIRCDDSIEQILLHILHHEKTHVLSHIKDQAP